MERGGKEQKESIIDTDVEPVDMIPDKRKNQKNHARKGKKKGKEKKDDTDGKIRGMLDEEM